MSGLEIETARAIGLDVLYDRAGMPCIVYTHKPILLKESSSYVDREVGRNTSLLAAAANTGQSWWC